MYVLKRRFEFEAAHRLPNHDGPCKNLHGHGYSVLVEVSRKDLVNGMVMDFGELKKIVNENVLNKLDHSYLNDLPYFRLAHTTAESIARYITIQIEDVLITKGVTVERVEVWETSKCCAEWRRE